MPGFTAVQDEQIAAWHGDGRFSGCVHRSVMGGIMSRFRKEPTTLVISKWIRTTGVCLDCGHALGKKLALDQRAWDCPVCGTHHNRDWVRARVIALLGAVQLMYPDCPSSLDGSVWASLLELLKLEIPIASGGCEVFARSGNQPIIGLSPTQPPNPRNQSRRGSQ